MQDELPESSPNGFLIAVVVVGVLAIGFALLFRAAMAPPVSAQIGKQFAPIEALGWINGSAPTPEDLKGKILVVDAWAFWCGPCRSVTPSIIELHDRFKSEDVVFLGLTGEGLDPKTLQLSKEYVKSLKIPWVNGYGATKTLTALEVEGIPQLWVVDRNNRIVFHEIGFNSSTIPQMEQTIREALKK